MIKGYFFGRRTTPATNTANNKTTLLTAATERWTLSFCIVLNLLKVVDSLLVEDLRPGWVGGEA